MLRCGVDSARSYNSPSWTSPGRTHSLECWSQLLPCPNLLSSPRPPQLPLISHPSLTTPPSLPRSNSPQPTTSLLHHTHMHLTCAPLSSTCKRAGSLPRTHRAPHPRVIAVQAMSPTPTPNSTRTVPINGVMEVADKYKAILLDQFGVLHDGKKPYSPATLSAVQALAEAGLKVFIISNSSRRSSGTIAKLAKMGFKEEWFAGAVTSGDMAHKYLSERPSKWWSSMGQKCIHTTWSSRGTISLDGLGLQVVTDPSQADFILAHGTEALGLPDGGGVEDRCLSQFSDLLGQCASQGRDIPMVVANPDLVTVNGAELITMPGTFAREYEQLGGKVQLMGKPDAAIYEAAMEALGSPSPSEVLAIGDSLEHDCAGAAAAGIHSLFIGGGIHGRELGIPAEAREGGNVDFDALKSLCVEMMPEGCVPTYAIPFLKA